MNHAPRPTARSGFGIATMMAVMVPALVLVVAIAHMFQVSTTRRITSESYSNYLAGEITESAIAEAAHLFSVRQLFPNVASEATFTTTFMSQMLADQVPGVAENHKAHWSLVDATGAEVQKMLVGLTFDDQTPGQEVPLKGLARQAAEMNPGIKVPDIRVSVKPISFRREYIAARQEWINWGVVAFRARVVIEDPNGPETHGLVALKLFTLRPSGQAGDVVQFSDRNLRTLVIRPNRRPRR